MISVIIPTIGREWGLKRAILSVISQGISELEIVVVNDSNHEIENDLASQYGDLAEIKIINSKKRSASGSRNLGIQFATRDYVTFLDDDDVFLPGRLQRFWKNRNLLDSKFSFLTTNRIYTDENAANIRMTEHPTGEIHLKDVLIRNIVDISLFCKRQHLINLNGFDDNLNGLEDWDLVIRLLADSAGYRLHSYDLLVFNHSMGERVSNTQDSQRLYLAKKHRNLIGENLYSKTLSRANYHSGKLGLVEGVSLTLSGNSILPIYLSIKLLLKKILRRT